MTRPDYIRAALESYPSLARVIAGLTRPEIIAALEIESSSQRRPTVIRRLIRRAVRLTELETRGFLEGKYMSHDKSDIFTAKKKAKPKKKKKAKK